MQDITLREADLRHMLTARRRTIQEDLRSRLRDGREDRSLDVKDHLEHSDTHTSSEMTLALMQMKAEALKRIEEALVRLDGGEYGRCTECANAISSRRLQALPFAVRCQGCESRREARAQQRHRSQSRTGLPLFSELVP